MFKWFGQQVKERKPKTKQLWGIEFNIVEEGLAEEEVVTVVDNLIAQHKASQRASAASLRAVLKTAKNDAEQIAASIKLKAQTEAEAETTRMISQAKRDAHEIAQEIERRAEIARQKEAEDVLSMAYEKAKIIEEEVRQKALLFLLRAREEIEGEIRGEYKMAYSRLSASLENLMSEGQNIEVELKGRRAALWEGKNFELKEYEAPLLGTSGVAATPTETSAPTETETKPGKTGKRRRKEAIQLQEEALEGKTEQPTQLQEEATEGILRQHPQEEGFGREETDSAQLKQNGQSLYAGEVELIIAVPVELKSVSKLNSYLQTVPDLRILYTRGSWDRGTTITVVLEKSMPLISILSETPGVEVIPELLEQDGLKTGKSSLLMGRGGKGVKRIKLNLKEA